MKLYEVNLRIRKPDLKKSRKKNPDLVPKCSIEIKCSYLMDVKPFDNGTSKGWVANLGRFFTEQDFEHIDVITNNLATNSYHSTVICPENRVQLMTYQMRMQCLQAIGIAKEHLEVMSTGMSELDLDKILSKTIITRDVI